MFSYEPHEEKRGEFMMLDTSGVEIGTVIDQESAETLLGYLRAGEGGFTIATFLTDENVESERQWAFVNKDDQWVAYTRDEESAKAILSYLNRGQ